MTLVSGSSNFDSSSLILAERALSEEEIRRSILILAEPETKTHV